MPSAVYSLPFTFAPFHSVAFSGGFLSSSDIPWNGPIGGVYVGMVDGKFVINPAAEERKNSILELTVAASEKKVVMIEAGAKEVSDEDMFDAIMLAHATIKDLLVFIDGIVAEVGKPKFAYPSCELDHDMFDEIFAYCENDVMSMIKGIMVLS